MMALYERQKTGRGQVIDVSLAGHQHHLHDAIAGGAENDAHHAHSSKEMQAITPGRVTSIA